MVQLATSNADTHCFLSLVLLVDVAGPHKPHLLILLVTELIRASVLLGTFLPSSTTHTDCHFFEAIGPALMSDLCYAGVVHSTSYK